MISKSILMSALVPGTMNALRWESEGGTIKELVLRNEEAILKGIAEMELNVAQLSAIRSDGSEHFISDFTGQKGLKISGAASGKSLRTKSTVKLKAGNYTAFRFYLGAGNTYTLKNHIERSLENVEHLDFSFDGELVIKRKESTELVLRFDFHPFDSKYLLEKFKSQFSHLNWIKAKMTAWA